MILLDDRSFSDHHFRTMIALETTLSKENSSRHTSCFEVRDLRRFLKVIFLQLVSALRACGVHSVDTKSEIVKILHFKQFYKHYVFNEDGDGGRKKVLKNYIDVYVCIDMVCGDTKGALGNEE
ncbi:Uncharacterised protein [Streptococcus pneumoniae]|nr:Uncharacterised protein [Streptococcus pneumoniae]CJN30487.1 Uncharacterised protein [Streptococcus pneumoniae]